MPTAALPLKFRYSDDHGKNISKSNGDELKGSGAAIAENCWTFSFDKVENTEN